ncbi:MAG: mucoidy inhibitor MuiA family protein, partial [Pseudomonadota bacterium]
MTIQPQTHRLLAAALLASTFWAGPAMAASFDVDSEVAQAVIYPSAASVTRAVPFDVPAGGHELVVELTGAGIDPNSVRLSGAAQGELTLVGVDTRRVEKLADTGERRRTLEEQISALQLELAAIGQRRSVAETQAQLVANLVNAIPTVFSADGEGAALPDAAQVLALLETVGQAQTRVVETRLQLGEEERTLNEQIVALQLELSSLPSRRDVLEAVIRIDAPAATNGELELSYLTNAVSWSPSYDLGLETTGETPRLNIRSQASIFQRTGEDWQNVALTLSTARPSGATQAGTLPAEQVSFLPPQPAPAPMATRSRGLEMQLEQLSVQDEAAVPKIIEEQAGQADFGGYRASFVLPGTRSLPTSDGQRAVLISQTDVEVELETRATPLLTTEAFLHATGSVPEGVTILPGQASLFRDGDLVGRTFLPRLTTGAQFDVGFGVDDAVIVERLVADRSTGETGIITSFNRERTAVTISVENLGDQPRSIRLIDRVPFSEADDIEIETSFPNNSAPNEIEANGQRGVLSWNF